MMTSYHSVGGILTRIEPPTSCRDAVWIDLLNPSKEEDLAVERELGLAIPTREEMREIEVSSRLYQESGAHFMTANIVFRVETPDPLSDEITFILTERQLITVRYAEPRAFLLYAGQASKGSQSCQGPIDVLLGLVEAIVEREADLTQRLQSECDRMAQTIFDMKGGSGTRARRFDVVMKQLGKFGDITSRTRESLVSLSRLLTYLGNTHAVRSASEEVRERVKTEAQDVHALADHISYLNSRLTFMLDASLGMVSIEQNQIIKLFSVVSVMLMPPTLIASVYGMNFRHMPELGWTWGYPLALGLMVLAAVVPFIYFKRKGWL